MIAAFDSAENAGNTGNMLFMLCLLFCGVLATPAQFPKFWIFMYRVSPFTYIVNGLLSAGLANTEVQCAANEFLRFVPFNGTCGEYMEPYMTTMGGYVKDISAVEACDFCPVKDTNVFLTLVSSEYSDIWRNFGIVWVFIVFNIFSACGLYWWVRVPSKTQKKKTE